MHPVVSNVTFAGQRLTVAADGSILTPVDEELALKMRRAAHIFSFSELPAVDNEKTKDAPVAPPQVDAAVDVEKVETLISKDDNVKVTRKRKRRKVD
jgi:hypothetical protein